MKKHDMVWVLIGVCLGLVLQASCSPYSRPTSTRKILSTGILADVLKVTPTLTTRSAITASPAPVLTLSTPPGISLTSTTVPYPPPQENATRQPSITPIETSIVTVFPASAGALPVLTHDLLFIKDHRVIIWDHITGQIDVKLDMNQWQADVVDPKLTYLGHQLIRISGAGQSEASYGSGSVDIEIIDIDTGKIHLLEHFDLIFGKNIVGNISVSPLGKWITYATADWPQGIDHPLDHITLYAIRLKSPYTNKKISDYIGTSLGAGDEFWSPDETRLLWLDDRGIWETDPSTGTNRLLIAQKIGTSGSVTPISAWSSSGRYLLVRIAGSVEGGSMGVLDTQTGQVGTIDGTFEYAVPAGKPGWISNDRLFVVYPGDWREGKFPLMGRIWSINPHNRSMFLQETEFSIDNVDSRFIPIAPIQLENGKLAFAIYANASSDMPTIPKDRWDSGLYVVNLDGLKAQRVNIFPRGFPYAIHWLPDGSGALVGILVDTSSDYWYYIPSDGGPLWDLTSLFGDGACCFQWLP